MAKNIIRWMIPRHVIYYRIVGKIDAVDVKQVDQQMLAMLNTSDADCVHLFIDTSLMTAAPNISHTKNLTYLQHNRLGLIITNNRNPIETFLFNAIGQVLNLSYRFVQDFEDELVYLSEYDATLPDIHILRQHLRRVQQLTLI